MSECSPENDLQVTRIASMCHRKWIKWSIKIEIKWKCMHEAFKVNLKGHNSSETYANTEAKGWKKIRKLQVGKILIDQLKVPRNRNACWLLLIRSDVYTTYRLTLDINVCHIFYNIFSMIFVKYAMLHPLKNLPNSRVHCDIICQSSVS